MKNTCRKTDYIVRGIHRFLLIF